MKLSQLLEVIPERGVILIFQEDTHLNRNRVYAGYANGIEKKNPIRKAEVNLVFIEDDTFIIEIDNSKQEETK